MQPFYKNSFEQASSKYEITGLLVRDFTCLEKNTIKCVAVYCFNVIMRKIPENMIWHRCGVVQTVTTEIQNETGSIIMQVGKKEEDTL